ncbi:MAG: hypothetical protein ACT4R6_03855 [Gemmatimonadaceae bacterium]
MTGPRSAFPDLSRVRAALAADYADLDPLSAQGTHVVLCARALGFGGGPVALSVTLGHQGEPVPPSVSLANEAEITHLLDHPNVMPVSLPRTIEGYWTFETPLLTGRTLEDVLARGERLPFARVVAILQDAASALDAAEAAMIVHGALRPSCMHLSANGACVLSGFTLGADRKPGPAFAAAGSLYEAPEQRRTVRVDGRADQYALAIIAHELLTGAQRALRDDTGVIEIQPLEIPLGRPLAPDVPLHTSDAIRKATARDPNARFESSGEFVDALAFGSVGKVKAPHVVAEEPKKEKRSYAAAIVLLGMMLLSAAMVIAPAGTSNAIASVGESVGGEPASEPPEGAAPTRSGPGTTRQSSGMWQGIGARL